MLRTLFTLYLLLASYIAVAEQFQPAITDTQWELINTPIECTLSQPIRDFGTAKFGQIAGSDFSLTFDTYTQPSKKGTVTFEVAEAPWQNSEQRQDIVIVKSAQGQTRFQIKGVNAHQALNHINEGRFPTIFYLSQHSQQEINVLMSTVHLQDYLSDFKQCLTGLLPYSFATIQNLTVNFELEKTDLGEREKAALLRMARYVTADPSIKKIAISGHTDNHGKRALNQTLSEGRAAVVKQFLMEHGVAESLILTEYHLEKIPVMSNKSQKGRAHNRRTEIEVSR